MIHHLITKAVRRAAREHPLLMPISSLTTNLLAFLAGGGSIAKSNEALFKTVLQGLGISPLRSLSEYFSEVINDKDLSETYMSAQAAHGQRSDDWAKRINSISGIVTIYYALVREIAPSKIVETGTASGRYTALLLAALTKNEKGELFSIDIPPEKGKLTMNMSVAREDIGYLIPACYREPWHYLEGDAKILLPKVMAEHTIDFFIHDSLHTVTHMLFEYAVARALCKENAVIVSDDILRNDAFHNFVRATRVAGYTPEKNPDVGLFINRFSDKERRQGIGIVKVSAEV